MRSLPVRQRSVVVLRYFPRDLSVEETAKVLGCAPGTVKSQASRRCALRAVIAAASEASDE